MLQTIYLYYTIESYLEPLYHWKPKWPSANLPRAKVLVPCAFGARLELWALYVVRKQYKTESLTKTTIHPGMEKCFISWEMGYISRWGGPTISLFYQLNSQFHPKCHILCCFLWKSRFLAHWNSWPIFMIEILFCIFTRKWGRISQGAESIGGLPLVHGGRISCLRAALEQCFTLRRCFALPDPWEQDLFYWKYDTIFSLILIMGLSEKCISWSVY